MEVCNRGRQAEFLRKEVIDLLDKLVSLGNTTDITMTNEEIDEGLKWNELLDHLYDEVSAFGKERGIAHES